MSKYTGGKSKIPSHNYDRVFCDHEDVPMSVVISELNSIEPLVEKLRKANERIAQLEKRGTKNERSLQKGMSKLNQRISDIERRNGAMEEYLKSRIRAFPQTHWENFLKLNPEFDTQHPQGESNEQQ